VEVTLNVQYHAESADFEGVGGIHDKHRVYKLKCFCAWDSQLPAECSILLAQIHTEFSITLYITHANF